MQVPASSTSTGRPENRWAAPTAAANPHGKQRFNNGDEVIVDAFFPGGGTGGVLGDPDTLVRVIQMLHDELYRYRHTYVYRRAG